MKYVIRKYVLFEIFEILYYLYDLVLYGWFKVIVGNVDIKWLCIKFRFIQSQYLVFFVYQFFKIVFEVYLILIFLDNIEEFIYVYLCVNSVFRQIYFKNKFLIINLFLFFILGFFCECYV